MAAIVRVGAIAFDLGNPAAGSGVEDSATDSRQIGIKAQNEFARRIDPLPRGRCNQTQKHRLVFEQTPEPARFHFSDELIVARCAAVLLWLRGVGEGSAGLPRFGEELIDCRSAEAGQLLQKRMAKASAGRFVQIVDRPCVDIRPKPRFGLFEPRAATGVRTLEARSGHLPQCLGFLAGLCNAASIQIASSIQAGGGAEALRRMVANLDST